MKHLLQLPLDILINIFINLHVNDLRSLMLTCRFLRNVILNNNTIWRKICRHKLIIYNSLGFIKPIPTSSYNLARISHNWQKGIYTNKTIIRHYTNYMPWVKYHNSKALLLTVGSELCCYPVDKYGTPNGRDLLWKLDVPKVKRYDVRTSDISRFAIKANLLVCGIRDGCTAVFNLSDINCKPELLCHIKNCHNGGQAEVSAVECLQNNTMSCVLTGSRESPCLCLWHLYSKENETMGVQNCSNELYDVTNVHTYENAGVRCIGVNSAEDKIAIGLDGNSKPLLLDVNMCKFLMRADDTRNVKEAVRDIQWHNENTIVYVTHSGALQLIDTRSCEMVYDALDPFQCTLYSVKTDCNNAIVVGSSQYSRCALFDMRNSRKHVQLYFTQKSRSPVYSLDFDSTKLIAAVDRGVSVLNFNINFNSGVNQQRDYSDAFEYCKA